MVYFVFIVGRKTALYFLIRYSHELVVKVFFIIYLIIFGWMRFWNK